MAAPVLTPKRSNFLTDDKKRQVATRGFSRDGCEEHLQHHLTNPSKYQSGVWCDSYCAARTFCGRATEENRKQMRKRWTRTGAALLARGVLLLKELAGPHGELVQVKLYDSTSLTDVAYAKEQYEREGERGELTGRKREQMRAIVGEDILGPDTPESDNDEGDKTEEPEQNDLFS